VTNPFDILVELQDRISTERLYKYGIDWKLLTGIVWAHHESIIKLSNRLIEDMDVNRRLPVGQRKDIVSPADAKSLTSAMLKGCSIFGSPPPSPLVRLNDKLLGADVQPRVSSKEPVKKRKAFLVLMENPKIGVRALARQLGVSQGTASKWCREFGDLENRVRARHSRT